MWHGETDILTAPELATWMSRELLHCPDVFTWLQRDLSSWFPSVTPSQFGMSVAVLSPVIKGMTYSLQLTGVMSLLQVNLLLGFLIICPEGGTGWGQYSIFPPLLFTNTLLLPELHQSERKCQTLASLWRKPFQMEAHLGTGQEVTSWESNTGFATSGGVVAPSLHCFSPKRKEGLKLMWFNLYGVPKDWNQSGGIIWCFLQRAAALGLFLHFP